MINAFKKLLYIFQTITQEILVQDKNIQILNQTLTILKNLEIDRRITLKSL